MTKKSGITIYGVRMKERLQKQIAASGYCSRRKADELIAEGKVTVNGVVASVGDSADIEKDRIEVDGILLEPAKKEYYILNKPAGYESTLISTTGKPTVVSLVRTAARVFPVGRLDVDSRGLLLLTNDGDWANGIAHPSSSAGKTYLVTVDGHLDDTDISQLEAGVLLEDGKTWPCEITTVSRTDSKTVVRMVLHEGKKRQIRRMMEKVGLFVTDILRESVGCVTLEGLAEGEYRALEEEEVENLRNVEKNG